MGSEVTVCLLGREHHGRRRGVVVETHDHCVFSRITRGRVSMIQEPAGLRAGYKACDLGGHGHWRDDKVVAVGDGSKVGCAQVEVNDKSNGIDEE